MRAVRSFDGDTRKEIRIATEVTRQITGQNAPALVSQTVPLQRKYCAMARPNRHGIMPNTAAVMTTFRRLLVVSIHCSFLEIKGKEPDRGLSTIADNRRFVRSNMAHAI
jgi:hypothetical protein